MTAMTRSAAEILAGIATPVGPAPGAACADKAGTPTGHWRHERAGEPDCAVCAPAYRAYDNAKKAASRRAAGCREYRPRGAK